MDIKHHTSETEKVIDRDERWDTTIGSYDVIVTQEQDHGCRISVYRSGAGRNLMRLGILNFSPNTVADLDAFAVEAESLIQGIAAMLREIGKNDLRSELERTNERLMAEMREQRERFHSAPSKKKEIAKRAQKKTGAKERTP